MSSLAGLLGQPFLRYAFIAGAVIAAASGLTGYFVVLRSQVFTGDALSHVAFTGALAALAAGANLLIGLYGACIVVALAMAALGYRGQADDTVIGSVFAWILGLGALFLSIYTTSTSNGTSGVNVLFGTIFGLSAMQAVTDSVVAACVCAALILIARPLLFATIDESVASARRVPVRAIGTVFLGAAGGTRRGGAAAYRPAVPRALALRGHSDLLGLGRPGDRLRSSQGSAELRDTGGCHSRVPHRHRPHRQRQADPRSVARSGPEA